MKIAGRLLNGGRPDLAAKIAPTPSEQKIRSKGGVLAIIVKGYPRLSETFIAQEILALQDLGYSILIVSLRHPTDQKTHNLHRLIKAPVLYLPEYLHDEPWRVLRSLGRQLLNIRLYQVLALFAADWFRDRTRNRARRFGQALVLASELPADAGWLYAHYLHTPSAVTRYTAKLRQLSWSISAHAKDIWTSEKWQIRQHLTAAEWCVTCTANNAAFLKSIQDQTPVHLIYHGLDFDKLPDCAVPERPKDEQGPLTIVTVARAVEKKGLDTLLEAFAQASQDRPMRWLQIGGGPERDRLAALANALGVGDRVEFLGALDREEVFAYLAKADLFCLPARIAADGDRDGLPNALMEAMHMRLPVIASNLPGIAELVIDGETGVLIEPDNVPELASAIGRLADDPQLRTNMGELGRVVVHERFHMAQGIERLSALLPKNLRACG